MPRGVFRAGPITDQYGDQDGSYGFNTTDQDFVFRSGIWLPVVKRKFLTTAATVTGATLGTITGLSVPIAASASYVVQFRIYYSTAGTTATNFDVLQTTFTSLQTSVLRKAQLTLTTEAIAGRSGTTTLGTALATFTATASTNMVCNIDCMIQSNTTAGTLNVQMATTAGQVITARVGSYAEWNRVQ